MLSVLHVFILIPFFIIITICYYCCAYVKQFQQEQVNRFCHRHYMSSQLPSSPEELSHLFSHLLYDDSKKVVFCYVPKNGCSNMKRLLLILNGILPPESAHETRPSEEVLKRVRQMFIYTTIIVSNLILEK